MYVYVYVFVFVAFFCIYRSLDEHYACSEPPLSELNQYCIITRTVTILDVMTKKQKPRDSI